MTHNSKDEDDKSLFQAHMRDVKPLKHRAKEPLFKEKAPIAPKVRLAPDVKPRGNRTAVVFLSDPSLLNIHAEDTLSYRGPELDLPRFKALKKGDFYFDARLDLHGFNVNTARDALSHFISNASEQGYRHLLVIHGKGGQHHHIGILKNHVAHWLKQFPEILAYHSAQAKDGGTGATYVLLKKQRH